MIKLFLEAHLDKLSVYNATIFQTCIFFDSQLKEWLSHQDERSDMGIIAGSKLVYRHPISSKHIIHPPQILSYANIEENITDLKAGFSNFIIAQCYEAHESFLKDVLSTILVNCPSIKIKDKRNRISRLNVDECRKDLPSNCKELIKILFEVAPSIKKTYNGENSIMFNFQAWLEVLSEVRHAIVHSTAIIKPEKIIHFSKFQRLILDAFFEKKITSKGLKVSTLNNYAEIIRKIAQQSRLTFEAMESIRS